MWGNKGMALEELINTTNEYYRENDIALVSKIPTNIKIKSAVEQMVVGNFKQGYIVDYVGIWNSKFIAFEAKQTIKNSFSISNLKSHQYKYLNEVSKHGGEAFIILNFVSVDKYYKIPIQLLDGLKSVNSEWCKEKAQEIFLEGFKLNYLFS